MNATFNFSRWWLLVKQHWEENGRRYLLFMPVIAGLILLWFVMDILGDTDNAMSGTTQSDTYFDGLILAGGLHAYTLFSPLNSRRKAIQYYTLPASLLEKLLCALFYGVFVFFIVYTIIFYLVDIPMVELARRIGKPYDMMVINGQYSPSRFKKVVNFFVKETNAGYSPEQIPIFFNIQAAVILGTVYFRKYSLLKTIIAITITLFASVLIISRLTWYLPGHWNQPTFLTWQINDYMGNNLTLAPPSWMITLVKTLALSLAPVLWYITWLRLQEKEV